VIKACTSASAATAGGRHLSAAAIAASPAPEASDVAPDGSTPRGMTLTAGRQGSSQLWEHSTCLMGKILAMCDESLH